MNGLRQHPFRVMGRLLWFAGVVLRALLDYLFQCALCSKGHKAGERVLWLQRESRRVLRIFKLEPKVAGPIPSSGLLISNHLSYLDILVLAAVTPAVFVAKHEVKCWPVIGRLAMLAGTLFIDRTRRMDVGQLNGEIEMALDRGLLVVLFPEGTSSNGKTVLPFKTSLLEPAVRQTRSLAVGCIGYALDDGDVSEEICYWRDMTFFPHMLNLLGKRTVRASVQFARFDCNRTNRKELALQLHAEILRLKENQKEPALKAGS